MSARTRLLKELGEVFDKARPAVADFLDSVSTVAHKAGDTLGELAGKVEREDNDGRP